MGQLPAAVAALFTSARTCRQRGNGLSKLPRPPCPLPSQVNGIATQLPIPLTVKVRIGENDEKINVDEVVGLLEEAGAAAVTVHGRYRVLGTGGGCECHISAVRLGSSWSSWLVFASETTGCSVSLSLLQSQHNTRINAHSPHASIHTDPPTCAPSHKPHLHCRTMQQRYKKPADWGLVGTVAAAHRWVF